MTLTTEQRKTIADLIGEGIHIGLRRYCDSPESAVAWAAISKLPDADWNAAVNLATGEVVSYIESGEDA